MAKRKVGCLTTLERAERALQKRRQVPEVATPQQPQPDTRYRFLRRKT